MTYKFKMEPWDHQRKALIASWNKIFFALLMGYGTGKTKVIIDNCGILFEQAKTIDALFVIAPNGVHEQWLDEQVPEHLPERIPYVGRVWTGKHTQKAKRELEEFWAPKNENKLKIFTMNVEALQSSQTARAFAINFLKYFRVLLAVDESTRIKTPGAKRTKFIVNRLSSLADYRRTLTGNEITRSPFDVFSPYQFLSADFWKKIGIPNFHIFTHRFGEWKKNRFPQKSIKVKEFTCPHCLENPDSILLKRQSALIFPTCNLCNKIVRETNHYPHAKDPSKQGKAVKYPKKLKTLLNKDGMFEYPKLLKYKNLDQLRAMTKAHSFLVRKEDCMDLPPKVYQPIYCEMNEDQLRVYKELKKNLYVEYAGVELEITHKIALRTRFRQINGGFFPNHEGLIVPLGNTNPKLDRMLYDLEDIDTDSPIIMWASFTAEIEAMAAALKKLYPEKRTEMFYGPTPKDKRPQLKADFKEGLIHFFVANPSVAGTGLNLQKAHINYIFQDTDKSEDRWQSEDRTHRGGQTKSCYYKDIIIKGTIDETLQQSNKEKKDIAEYFKGDSIEEFLEKV